MRKRVGLSVGVNCVPTEDRFLEPAAPWWRFQLLRHLGCNHPAQILPLREGRQRDCHPLIGLNLGAFLG